MLQAAPSRRSGVGVLLAVLAALATAGACGSGVSDDPEILARLPERVDFNHHVQPLFADRCYACHGPDEKARKAGLRLDSREGAMDSRLESGGRAVVPGSLRRSEVWHRISSTDPKFRMPQEDSNLELSAYERALIGRWIEQGAEWKPHWAFIPPERPEPPQVGQVEWVRTPIDRFVLARLERGGLSPSPEADKERLLRRVSFDLTGLPPLVEEIDAFLADDSPDAYEKVVDRLLASPAYGERMALDWLDLARYADSHGLHADGYRYMWPWRDWVIEAFNEDVPFDRFLTWQFAGDLLPDASREQVLATAFHRNHPMTAEGGVIDEEFRLEYVFDRAETTAKGLMALTLECARCHDHKFDPILQREFYEFSAFFNNVDELGMTGDDGNAGPLLPLPELEVEAELLEVRTLIEALEAEIGEHRSGITRADLEAVSFEEADAGASLVAHYPLDRTFEKLPEPKPVSGSEAKPEPETWTPNRSRPSSPARVGGTVDSVDGARGSALAFDDEYDYIDLIDTGLFERTEPFSVAFWVRPESDEPYRVILGNAGHKNSWWRGYELYLDVENRLSARLIHAFPHNYIHVRTESRLPWDQWTHLALTYDASSRASGVGLFIDGRRAELSVEVDRLYKSIWPIDGHHKPAKTALRVGRSYREFSGENGYFTGGVDDLRVYDRRLTAAEVRTLTDAEGAASSLAEIATRSPEAWTEEEVEFARDHYLHRQDREYRRLLERLRPLREKEHELIETVPEVMVMEERGESRPLHVLDRGAYDAPGEAVSPGTPRAVLPFPEALPPNRLGLVQWLLSPSHPLTARVAVNRYWQLYFGKGIVETTENFGYQGALPTHPELLDWLAVEFRESGWAVKAFQRLIVTSATYRQDSHAGPEQLETDPENGLLARGPRHRLPAEMIRDNALAASGLLVRQVGGPSVRPYQPPGLWREKGVFSKMLLDYKPDTGDGLYRRSLYTFLKRTSPPPAMVAFDAPSRSDCVVRRQTTSTPLQALVLLNDPQYVEAARMLAERMIREGGDEPEARIALGFRLATSRHPRPAELEVLAGLHKVERLRFESDPRSADELLGVGEAPWDQRLDRREVASLAVVASMMLNHDEAYTKR